MKKGEKTSPGRDIISIRFVSVVLMSFVLILALLGLLYHQFQKAFLSSINRANEEFVFQVSATSSSTEEFLQNMVNQIFYSNTVVKLRSYEELTNWQMVDGVRELNTYSASSTIIDSIYIFNGKQQRVYSTSSYGAVGDSFSAFADRDAVELYENRSASGRLVPILRHSDVSNIYSNRELYSFLFFELDRDGLPKDNAIMFNINKNWLNRLYFGGEDAFIIKEDRALVASAAREGEELYPLLTEKILSRAGEGVDSGYFIYQAEDRQICFFSRMPDRPWYYVKSLPYDQCLEDLRHTEEQTFLFVIAGFGILLLAGTMISVDIYVPLRKITRRISDIAPDAPQNTDAMLESLNHLIESNSNARQIQASLRTMVRGEVLQGLLFGSQEYESPEALIREYDLQLLADRPIQLCLIDGLRLPLYLECVRDGQVRCEGVIVHNEYTILFLQVEQEPQAVLDRLSAQFPARWFVVGTEAEGFAALPQVYGRLVEFYELRFLYQSGPMLFVRDYPQLDDSPAEPEARVSDVMDALKKGYGGKAGKAYLEFLTSLNGKSGRCVQYTWAALTGAVLKLYFECFPGEADPDGGYQAVSESLRFSPEALNGGCEAVFTRIAEHIQQKKASRKGSSLDQVIAAIEDSYCDSNLSSQVLADRFNLSTAYLCRIFRQAKGCSLTDYINQLRIARAQEILRDPSVKVKDVAEQVGIENKQYFFMLFKQTTGVTPKQYQIQQKGV